MREGERTMKEGVAAMKSEVNWNRLRDEALSMGYDGHNRKPARVSRKTLRDRRWRRRSRAFCRHIVRLTPATVITRGVTL